MPLDPPATPSAADGTATALAAQSSVNIEELLVASRNILTESSLKAALTRVVECGRAFAGGRYGALSVIGPDGLLEQFVSVGLDAEQVEAIGNIPLGTGLLGALLTQSGPIRLDDVTGDARSKCLSGEPSRNA